MTGSAYQARSGRKSGGNAAGPEAQRKRHIRVLDQPAVAATGAEAACIELWQNMCRGRKVAVNHVVCLVTMELEIILRRGWLHRRREPAVAFANNSLHTETIQGQSAQGFCMVSKLTTVHPCKLQYAKCDRYEKPTLNLC